jgi:hypothetical protein
MGAGPIMKDRLIEATKNMEYGSPVVSLEPRREA